MRSLGPLLRDMRLDAEFPELIPLADSVEYGSSVASMPSDQPVSMGYNSGLNYPRNYHYNREIQQQRTASPNGSPSRRSRSREHQTQRGYSSGTSAYRR